MSFFEELGLAQPLLKALAASGYDTPTPIQMQAIPPLLEGRDLCGIAQTGTGKTAAFALPTLHRLSLQPKSPTRGSARPLPVSEPIWNASSLQPACLRHAAPRSPNW